MSVGQVQADMLYIAAYFVVADAGRRKSVYLEPRPSLLPQVRALTLQAAAA